MNSSQNHRRAGEAGFDPEVLLVLAEAGDGAALGRLLERYRNHMAIDPAPGRPPVVQEDGHRGSGREIGPAMSWAVRRAP
jgi:hypothetical protein